MPTRRIPILYWIVLGASTVGAIYAWVVFITTLNFHVYPTDKFIVSLVGSTAIALYWITYTLIRITRRWPNREATNRLCEHAVKIHRALDAHELYDKDDPAAIAIHHGLLGRLTGIRIAICLLNDWDPHHDADTEGPADELVEAYWEKTYPQDWEIPT